VPAVVVTKGADVGVADVRAVGSRLSAGTASWTSIVTLTMVGARPAQGIGG
jgi:hypothetical protein